MNYVSLLFAAALIAIAGFATASETKSLVFHYNNSKAYYSCSYAEARTAKTLAAVGAENVTVDCMGGIEESYLLPVKVDATFTHGEKGARTVVLKGNESCDFNVKLIQAVLAQVDHETVKAQSSCWDAKGRYYFEITLK